MRRLIIELVAVLILAVGVFWFLPSWRVIMAFTLAGVFLRQLIELGRWAYAKRRVAKFPISN